MKQGQFRLGLTGSIGMGKSTTAEMFRKEGIPVWDADAAVHRLYAPGGAGTAAIAAIAPHAVRDDAVDRAVLAVWAQEDPRNLRQLEDAIHPLVAADRERFLAGTEAPIVVLDIPLLYETGAEAWLDAVLVVTAPEAAQRARVLARPGMSEAKFSAILERQMPDAEKCARADFVIETTTLEAARSGIQNVLRDIRDRLNARDRARHGDDGIRSRDR